METLKLKDHPRLYVPADVAENLAQRLHGPFLQREAERVLEDAEGLVRARPPAEPTDTAYQPVTRAIDAGLQCLTCAWVLTRETRFRKAAIRRLAHLATFRQISCEARVTTPPDAELPFCLSYGELSATVGLMFDLFRPELADAEREAFFAVLDRFLMRAAVRALEAPPWWANKEWSNWNGVCAGGMGILALAFHDDVPDARRLIPFVERSLGEYFKSYVRNGGGCHEGTGYWNYGMNYAVRYLLSWENATGRKHPALRPRVLGDSLFFPLDFAGISFGDNDRWHPAAFFFLLARRMKRPNAALRAAAYLDAPVRTERKQQAGRAATGDLLYAADAIPTEAEMARLRAAHARQAAPVARVYSGMDWGALADDEAFPRLRMAVRGGSSAIAGHGMLDLLSIRCRVNGELMITDQQDGSYMPSTFSRRGHELYGRSAASKSTLFVDGLGCAADATCNRTQVVRGPGLLGIRIDASRVFLPRWKGVFIGRLVLMVDRACWLVIDRVQGANAADRHWIESRFHTLAETRCGRDGVALKSGREWMQMTFASLGGSLLREARGLPSQPATPPTTILRWMGAAASEDHLHVAALQPGRRKLRLSLARGPRDGYTIALAEPGGKTRRLRLGPRLTLRD